jgi:hypothetical protein
MIIRRSRFSDIAALYAGLGIATPRASEYQALACNLALGPAWTFRATSEGPIAALAGIVWELDAGVIWFRSGAGAEMIMPRLVRAFRGMIAAVARGAEVPIVTWEQELNPVGQRIATALGFEDRGQRLGHVQVWEWRADDGKGREGGTRWAGHAARRQ